MTAVNLTFGNDFVAVSSDSAVYRIINEDQAAKHQIPLPIGAPNSLDVSLLKVVHIREQGIVFASRGSLWHTGAWEDFIRTSAATIEDVEFWGEGWCRDLKRTTDAAREYLDSKGVEFRNEFSAPRGDALTFEVVTIGVNDGYPVVLGHSDSDDHDCRCTKFHERLRHMSAPDVLGPTVMSMDMNRLYWAAFSSRDAARDFHRASIARQSAGIDGLLPAGLIAGAAQVAIVDKHGIKLERFAPLETDALRAAETAESVH